MRLYGVALNDPVLSDSAHHQAYRTGRHQSHLGNRAIEALNVSLLGRFAWGNEIPESIVHVLHLRTDYMLQVNDLDWRPDGTCVVSASGSFYFSDKTYAIGMQRP